MKKSSTHFRAHGVLRKEVSFDEGVLDALFF